jgi:hypothetical protein
MLVRSNPRLGRHCALSLAISAIVGLPCLAAIAEERNMRSEILDKILARVDCCTEDQRFSKPAARANIPANLGIAIGQAGVDDTIHIGTIVRGRDGALELNGAYSLDANCRPVSVSGPALRPVFALFTVDEIARRGLKDPPERLWPTVNATFQSTLLTILKHPTPVARFTCMRRHLDRVIHGEAG